MSDLRAFRTLAGEVVPDALGWYFAGLVDGEGCFYIGRAGCSFIVKLRDDDLPLLASLQQRLGGIGRISIKQPQAGYPNRRAQADWRVTRHRELVWLTELLDVFTPLSKKARDYALWRDAVIEHANGMPPAQLEAYRRALADTRAYPEVHA